MRRTVAVIWHASFSVVAGALYFFFTLPRWWELTDGISHTWGTVLRLVTAAVIALAALPVVFTWQRTRKPEYGVPRLALTLRIWSIVAHVLAGVLIAGAAISEIWLDLDKAGQWLFGVYGAAAAIALLGIGAFYLSFVAELPPKPPKPLKPKKTPKESKKAKKKKAPQVRRRRRDTDDEAQEDEEADEADLDEDAEADETEDAEAEAEDADATETDEAETDEAEAEDETSGEGSTDTDDADQTTDVAEDDAEPDDGSAGEADTDEGDSGDESGDEATTATDTEKSSHFWGATPVYPEGQDEISATETAPAAVLRNRRPSGKAHRHRRRPSPETRPTKRD